MEKETLKDKMKKGLGGSLSSSKKSIFEQTVPVNPPMVEPPQPESPQAEQPKPIPKEPSKPLKAEQPKTVESAQPKEKRQIKADIFTERVTLVISGDQRDKVEKLARDIQRNGLKKPERITANTVIRCLIDILDEFNLDTSDVKSEDDLQDLFKQKFIQK